VVIVDYDPEWPRYFAALREVIATALGDLAQTIEHVGSTAVPGLAAKPIIDMDVALERMEDLDEAVRRLVFLGYTHQGDQGIPTREAFARTGEDVPRDGSGRTWMAHHLYLCHPGSPEMVRHLALRDYLREHDSVAQQYGVFKKRLAAQYGNDREGYTDAKASFIEDILRRTGFDI
jgi:GrpB-like predicted nucleotidyltransferase (UPF0157 family)